MDTPSEPGSGKTVSMTMMFHLTLKTLPVDLAEYVKLSKTNPDILFTEQTMDRLLQVILAEQDTRISNKATKLQVIEILRNVANVDREHRYALRTVMQDCETWFDDDVDPEVRERTLKDGHGELLPERDRELVMKVKLIFALCWSTPPALLKSLIQDESVRIEQCKLAILRNYAATAMQALIRSKRTRLHLHRSRREVLDEQEEEIRQWSVLLIQKVARGYIARRTVVRSMQIRKTLNKEVLRLAERYLQHGDLWGFLKDVNEELTRCHSELREHQAREDDWAQNFVEKVIHKRQSEFNTAWDVFPKALRGFNGKGEATGALMTKLDTYGAKKTVTAAGAGAAIMHATETLSPQKRQLNGGGVQPLLTGTATSAAVTTGMPALTAGASFLSTATSATALTTTTTGTGTIKTGSRVSPKRGTRRTMQHSTVITPDEVGTAMAYDQLQSLKAGEAGTQLGVPGVLMRKALGTTVKAEVADQLNRLINGQYRSKQLVRAIQDAYGPHSDAHKKVSSKTQLAPLQVPSKTSKRKKKRVGLKGEVIEDVGRMDASHSDWLTASANISHDTGNSSSGSGGKGGQTAETGTSLLIDVPQGINDTIERLMHAAALRCYVPDFFQGVQMPDHSCTEDGVEAILDSLGDASIDETKVEQILLQRKRRQQENPNANADYAYAMYLKMPFGLAKMRYELQCKQYAQGPINRLKMRGLTYLADVQPVSKFMVCLRSVETPRVLLNKCIDVYWELRAMGSAAPLGTIDRDSEQKFHRSVHTSQASRAQSGSHTAEGTTGPLTRGGGISGTATERGASQLLRGRSVQFASTAGEGSVADGAGAAAGQGGRLSPSLRQGEIGFESIAEGEELPPGAPADRLGSSSITGQPSFADTVQGRVEQRRHDQHQNELPGKMLLSMVENRDQLSWCDLRAPVEDIFLHAAYLVVPHVSYVPDLSAMRGASSSAKLGSASGSGTGSGLGSGLGSGWMDQRSFRTGSMKMKRVETPMGNQAFKLHTAEVLKLTDETQKREVIKERFRASFILTTPFTLYLKGKGVYTVDDLLRVNLRDLAMPAALETQLEVLLTAVVSKCVDAKIVPIPRDHLSTASELFTVPMFYDPKFQRSPLDPFGRPPRLQPGTGAHRRERLVQRRLKATERKQQSAHKAHSDFSKVASVAAIQEDLDQPVTLWASSAAAGTEGAVHLRASLAEGEDEEDDGYGGSSLQQSKSLQEGNALSLGASLLDDVELDGKWSFHVEESAEVNDDGISRPGTRQGRGGTPSSNRRTSSRGTQRSDAHPSGTTDTSHPSATTERVRAIVEGAEVPPPKDSHTWQKSLRSSQHDAARSPPKAHRESNQNKHKQFSQAADLMTRNIEDKVFKYSFVCTHPHCGQVFSRQYTYNIHLKSHELFGQYHDFKKRPQLVLDPDRAQIQAGKEKQFEDHVSLPPLVQAELQNLSISR